MKNLIFKSFDWHSFDSFHQLHMHTYRGGEGGWDHCENRLFYELCGKWCRSHAFAGAQQLKEVANRCGRGRVRSTICPSGWARCDSFVRLHIQAAEILSFKYSELFYLKFTRWCSTIYLGSKLGFCHIWRPNISLDLNKWVQRLLLRHYSAAISRFTERDQDDGENLLEVCSEIPETLSELKFVQLVDFTMMMR